MVNEVVCLHLGQAGCQIGTELWEQFCVEHNIKFKGVKDPTEQASSGSSNTFFAEKRNGQYVPRAVFMDTDPSYVDALHKSKVRDLFAPDNILAYKQDCRGNFFEARTQASEYKILAELTDRIRKTADACEAVQGFFLFHGIGGGTGSGIGAELLNILRDDFNGKEQTIQCGIYPSPTFSGTVCECYNSVLHTANTVDGADLTFCLDNENTGKACAKNLGIKQVSFSHVNALLAQAVSMATTSLRYQTELSANLQELTANLVPAKPFRYCLLALSPLCSPSSERAKKGFTLGGDGDIIQDLLKPSNVMCNVGHTLRLNRFLSASLLVRGKMKSVVGGNEAPTSSGASSAGGFAAGKVRTRNVERDDVQKSLLNLMKRRALNFLPWQNNHSWKLGLTSIPPSRPAPLEEALAKSTMQACLIGNSTCIRSLFMEQYRRFLKLFYNKAYVWHFLEANGELEEFYEAKESVRRLIDAYEELLARAAQVEDPKGKLAVSGQTSSTKEGVRDADKK
ncbi:unnamed protein product [Amoebophrya sp. A25]|nr:unnamed protein product [Amoebophrya sp. A25]|eukprot:GSA25T00010051001.1